MKYTHTMIHKMHNEQRHLLPKHDDTFWTTDRTDIPRDPEAITMVWGRIDSSTPTARHITCRWDTTFECLVDHRGYVVLVEKWWNDPSRQLYLRDGAWIVEERK